MGLAVTGLHVGDSVDGIGAVVAGANEGTTVIGEPVTGLKVGTMLGAGVVGVNVGLRVGHPVGWLEGYWVVGLKVNVGT